MVSPILEEIAQERNDIKVGKVNVDEQPELASGACGRPVESRRGLHRIPARPG